MADLPQDKFNKESDRINRAMKGVINRAFRETAVRLSRLFCFMDHDDFLQIICSISLYFDQIFPGPEEKISDLVCCGNPEYRNNRS